jgi:hypothetical protein
MLKSIISTVSAGLLLALGLQVVPIPAPVAVAARALNEQLGTMLTEWAGPEQVALYDLDRVDDAAHEQEADLKQLVAENRVDYARLAAQQAELKAAEEPLRLQLIQLAELVESGEAVTVASGELWTPEQIRDYTNKHASKHQAMVAQMATNEETLGILADTIARGEVALAEIRLTMSDAANQRQQLLALVAQGEVLARSGRTVPNAGAVLADARASVDSLIDAQRRANAIQLELLALDVDESSSPLDTGGDDELLSYINSLENVAVSR